MKALCGNGHWDNLDGKYCATCKENDGTFTPVKAISEMSDNELTIKASHAIQPRPVYEPMKQQLSQTDIFALAKFEIRQRLAGDIAKPLALFLHLASVLVKNSKRNLILTGPFAIGKDYSASQVAELFPKHLTIYRRRITPRALDYLFADKENEWLSDYNLLLEDVPSSVMENSASLKTFASAPADKPHTVSIVDRGRCVNLRMLGRPNITITTANSEAPEEVLSRFDSLEFEYSENRNREILISQGKSATGEKETPISKVAELLEYFEQVEVIIPYAEQLAQVWPLSKRSPREQPRFFALLSASAALNQFRRDRDDKGRIIANFEDYENAKAAFSCFTQGELAGLTRPLLACYRAVKLACEARQTKPQETWQVDNNGNRTPQPDISLAGWATTQDISQHTQSSESLIYRQLNALRERGVIELRHASIYGSAKPVKLFSASEVRLSSLPTVEQLGGQLNQLNQLDIKSTFETSEPNMQKTYSNGSNASNALIGEVLPSG